MSKQIFKFGQPAANALTDALADANPNFRLPASQMTYGAPSVVSGSQVSVSAQSTTVAGINFTGAVAVTYDRLSLSDFFVGVTPRLDASSGTDNASLLTALMNRYQIYASTDNSNVPGQQNSMAIVVDNTVEPQTATVTAGPSNLIWRGEQVFLLSGEQSLASILPNVSLTSLTSEPALAEGQSYAEAYYGTNYSVTSANPDSTDLLAVANLVVDAAPPTDSGVWTLGNHLTGDEWVDQASPADFNINGAVVAYNGDATGDWVLNGPLASLYNKVCVITLGANCTNLVGNLVIPYHVTVA